MSDIRKKKTKWFKYVVLCFSMTWWTEKKKTVCLAEISFSLNWQSHVFIIMF